MIKSRISEARARARSIGVGEEDLRAREARQQLETLLEDHKLNVRFVTPTAFDDRILSRLHIDRMITTACERPIAAYAELDRLHTGKTGRRRQGARPVQCASL